MSSNFARGRRLRILAAIGRRSRGRLHHANLRTLQVVDGTKHLSDFTELLLGGLLRTIAGRWRLDRAGGRVAQLGMSGIVDDRTDLNVYGKPLAGLSSIYAADGSNIAVVTAISNAHVTHSDWRTQSWIETEPVFAGRLQQRVPGRRQSKN